MKKYMMHVLQNYSHICILSSFPCHITHTLDQCDALFKCRFWNFKCNYPGSLVAGGYGRSYVPVASSGNKIKKNVVTMVVYSPFNCPLQVNCAI